MTVMRRCTPFIYTAIAPSQAPSLSSHMVPSPQPYNARLELRAFQAKLRAFQAKLRAFRALQPSSEPYYAKLQLRAFRAKLRAFRAKLRAF